MKGHPFPAALNQAIFDVFLQGSVELKRPHEISQKPPVFIEPVTS
jgi:hypothetical protein